MCCGNEFSSVFGLYPLWPDGTIVRSAGAALAGGLGQLAVQRKSPALLGSASILLQQRYGEAMGRNEGGSATFNQGLPHSSGSAC
jgi:hypothetical protein